MSVHESSRAAASAPAAPYRVEHAPTRLGDTYRKTGEFEKAIDQYKAALAIDSKNPYALTGLGHLYFENRNYRKSLSYWHQLIESQNDNIFALNSMGNCYRKLKNYNEALKFFFLVLDKEKDDFYALYGIADSYRGLKEYDRAAEYWQKIQKQDPNNKDILTRLGDSYRNLGDIEKAEILVPHLMLAIHNVNTISKIQGWEKQFLSPDEATDEGLLLLDHKFRPIHSNAKAREICLYLCNRIPPDIINLEKGEFPMPSSIVKDCSDLLELFKADARFILWPKERIIFVESGKNFRSECSLIWKTDQINSTPNFMVTLSDLTDKKKKLENTLQVSFHLSKREVDIVYCIMADMSYNEIAEMLYISKLTVRTHVKNIYRKLKITNKIELYRFIQSLTWLI